MYKLNIIIFSFILFAMNNCAVLDYPKRFLGYSTAKFKSESASKFSKNFKTSKPIAFKKSLNIINKLKAQITHQSYNKNYIVVFNLSKYFDNTLDSTEVAIFIEEIDIENIKITISCNNSLLAKKFSDKFFEMFMQDNQDWKL
jgi:hypothetical protein